MQSYYNEFLERTFEEADHPAPANTFFISHTPNLTEDFLNDFISTLEDHISELKDREENNISATYNRHRLLFDLEYLYNILNESSIYELATYKADESIDEFEINDNADELAELIAYRNQEILEKLIDNAEPCLNLIKEIIGNLEY